MARDGDSNAMPAALSDPLAVRDWLAQHHPKQLALLDKFEIDLRLGRLSTPSAAMVSKDLRMDRRAVTVRTVELLRTMIGGTRWRTPAQLVALLRGLGRELHSAGGFREPAIGNVVRRIIAAVREEVMNGATPDDQDGTPKRSKNDRSLESMLWAVPQHVKPGRGKTNQQSKHRTQRSESVGDALEASDLPPQFFQNRPDLKQSVMEAIQEITSDLEDLHKNINDQATNQIHAGEVILTYGRSQTVELVRYMCGEKYPNRIEAIADSVSPPF
jgi:translation initiation factor eIF-2B subunit beta